MPLNAINICEQLWISNKLKSSDNALLVDKDPAWLPEKFEDQLNYEILRLQTLNSKSWTKYWYILILPLLHDINLHIISMYRDIKHGYLIFSWLLQDVNYDESANFKPQRNMHNMNVIQSTWLLGLFFFLSRRTDYKHNYLVQCQIREARFS